MCLYILFYVTLIRMESKTIVVSDITPDIFNELSSEHDQSLSCPCTTTTILYKNFVSNNVTMHSVCSSNFVDKQWIQGLYFENQSSYIFYDFRATAFSQVSLLLLYFIKLFLFFFVYFSLNFYQHFVQFRKKSFLKLKKILII